MQFLTPLFLIMLLNFAIGALIVIEARPFIGVKSLAMLSFNWMHTLFDDAMYK